MNAERVNVDAFLEVRRNYRAEQWQEIADARERHESYQRWQRYASGDRRAFEPDHWEPTTRVFNWLLAGIAAAVVVILWVLYVLSCGLLPSGTCGQ